MKYSSIPNFTVFDNFLDELDLLPEHYAQDEHLGAREHFSIQEIVDELDFLKVFYF